MDLNTLLAFPIGFSTSQDDPKWLPIATEASEGYDIHHCGRSAGAIVTLAPREESMVGTGLFVTKSFPKHLAMLVLPRSSTGKRSISVPNSSGLVDRGYVGREIKLMLRNDGAEPQVIEHGERLAQLLFVLCAHPFIRQTPALPEDSAGR